MSNEKTEQKTTGIDVHSTDGKVELWFSGLGPKTLRVQLEPRVAIEVGRALIEAGQDAISRIG